MDFLQLAGKTVVVCGLANRKSVAWHVGQLLTEAGAHVVYTVRTSDRQQAVARFSPDAETYICDVEHDDHLAQLREAVAARHPVVHGLVHSIAFASYEGGPRAFQDVPREDFLRSVGVSCYSLMALARTFQPIFDPDASVVTISISTTRMASESYGYMAPVKAALDSAIVFLAKSFSQFSRVRFNAVAPGLLKTSASAGIPGYVDAYLYAEQATLRKAALKTEEVAATAAFLLSPRSSGINGQRIVVDAGMEVNYFDRGLIDRAMRPD
ncbi:MAG TPA: SDR family oxidoreductase [Pirellulales bacterium]|nr:SDR family oxidoreductase [Pirellulales bacterium]